MKTKAVRLYGKSDLRLEEFELPEIKDDEILATVVSDSICMSSYKAAIQGGDHKRVPEDIAEHPTIIGHEFCGELVEVGKKWQDKFKAGEKFSIQPAMNYKGSLDAPGYSYQAIICRKMQRSPASVPSDPRGRGSVRCSGRTARSRRLSFPMSDSVHGQDCLPTWLGHNIC